MMWLLGALAISTTLKLDAGAQLEALAARADVAAHVRVLSTEARFEGGRIVSDFRCEVIEAGFGVSAGDVITLTTLGGIRDNIGQRVHGLVRPGPGDELAVLLGKDGYQSGGRPIIGFSLGLYHVVRGEWESPENAVVVGNDVIYRGPLRETAPLTLAEFMRRAKAAHP